MKTATRMSGTMERDCAGVALSGAAVGASVTDGRTGASVGARDSVGIGVGVAVTVSVGVGVGVGVAVFLAVVGVGAAVAAGVGVVVVVGVGVGVSVGVGVGSGVVVVVAVGVGVGVSVGSSDMPANFRTVEPLRAVGRLAVTVCRSERSRRRSRTLTVSQALWPMRIRTIAKKRKRRDFGIGRGTGCAISTDNVLSVCYGSAVLARGGTVSV